MVLFVINCRALLFSKTGVVFKGEGVNVRIIIPFLFNVFGLFGDVVLELVVVDFKFVDLVDVGDVFELPEQFDLLFGHVDIPIQVFELVVIGDKVISNFMEIEPIGLLVGQVHGLCRMTLQISGLGGLPPLSVGVVGQLYRQRVHSQDLLRQRNGGRSLLVLEPVDVLGLLDLLRQLPGPLIIRLYFLVEPVDVLLDAGLALLFAIIDKPLHKLVFAEGLSLVVELDFVEGGFVLES